MRERIIGVLVGLVMGSSVAAQDGRQPEAIAPLLRTYCVGCHGAEKPKGDLRLDNLSADFGAQGKRWQSVLQRLTDGTMPPRAKPRPTPTERQTLLTWLQTGLTEHQARTFTSEGRTRLRRLSRVEYGHTVRDLLGIDLDVSELLPEDATASGFDKVDNALSLSPVLVERYLAAAEAALDAAIVSGPRPETIKKRIVMKEFPVMAEKIASGRIVGQTADAAVFYFTDYFPYDLRGMLKLPAGRYRFRISAYAHQSAGKPIVLRAFVGSFNSNQGKSHLAGFWEIPANKPTVVEFEDRIETPQDAIRPAPYGTGNPWRFDNKIAEYRGPGIAVQWIDVEGPLFDNWPPESHRRLLGDVSLDRGTPADAERLLRQFLPRAFRRPVTDPEVQRYLKMVGTRLQQGQSFEQAMRVAYKAILCSSHFLLLQEKPGPLDDFALASRLSYFLWSSLPDEPLLELARRGELRKPETLRAQVERLLNDPKARRFTENFTGQWLGLRNIDFTTPDKQLYPEFDDLLRYSMLEESYRFFEEILRQDRSSLEFVHSDWTILNERLAKHYGVPEVEGLAFRKVALKPEYHRGGVLTQASVLKVTANGTTTSPIIRGAWVLDRILGQPAPNPPANVPAVEPDIRGATTIREQLAKHRTLESCASCHVRMDPPGFALENFDVIGGWRDRYRAAPGTGRDSLTFRVNNEDRWVRLGPRVEASDVLPDGSRFANVDGFKRLLLRQPDVILRNLASRLVTYATGHAIELADGPAIATILERTTPRDHGFRSLVHEVVQSKLFLNK